MLMLQYAGAMGARRVWSGPHRRGLSGRSAYYQSKKDAPIMLQFTLLGGCTACAANAVSTCVKSVQKHETKL